MRRVAVVLCLLVLNALLLPVLLRWIWRSAYWLREPGERGRVVVRLLLDELAQWLMFWRYPDRENPATSLLLAVAVLFALLLADAWTLTREFPAAFGSHGAAP